MTYFVHSSSLSTRSEFLAMGASLRGEKMYPQTRLHTNQLHTNILQYVHPNKHWASARRATTTLSEWVIYNTKPNTHWLFVVLVISLIWLLIIDPLFPFFFCFFFALTSNHHFNGYLRAFCLFASWPRGSRMNSPVSTHPRWSLN